MNRAQSNTTPSFLMMSVFNVLVLLLSIVILSMNEQVQSQSPKYFVCTAQKTIDYLPFSHTWIKLEEQDINRCEELCNTHSGSGSIARCKEMCQWKNVGFQQNGLRDDSYEANGYRCTDPVTHYTSSPSVGSESVYHLYNCGWDEARYSLWQGASELFNSDVDFKTNPEKQCIQPKERNVCWTYTKAFQAQEELTDNENARNKKNAKWSIGDGVPESWTCDAKHYANDDGCHCKCGEWDPDCDDRSQRTIGCPSDLDICLPPGDDCAKRYHVMPVRKYFRIQFGFGDYSINMWQAAASIGPYDSAGYEFYSMNEMSFLSKMYHNVRAVIMDRKINVPEEWTCPKQYYNSDDGCDCECGAWDPDCDKHQDELFEDDPFSMIALHCPSETNKTKYVDGTEQLYKCDSKTLKCTTLTKNEIKEREQAKSSENKNYTLYIALLSAVLGVFALIVFALVGVYVIRKRMVNVKNMHQQQQQEDSVGTELNDRRSNEGSNYIAMNE